MTRWDDPYAGHASGPVEGVVAHGAGTADRYPGVDRGKGPDVVSDAVGNPLYEIGQKAMAAMGASRDRGVLVPGARQGSRSRLKSLREGRAFTRENEIKYLK